MIQIKLFGKYNFEGYTLLEGFPGAGLVGPMANSYIIEKLNMEYIGYIESDKFPPITAIHDKIPMFPVRIYKEDKYKLIAIISEFTIPTELIYELGSELMDFIRKNNLSNIISIGGIPTQKPTENAFIISSEKDMLQKASSMGIKPIEEGVIAGVSAILLANATEFKIPVINILVEVDPNIMDPKYAEVAITNLKKITDIDINIDELEKEAKLVEAKVREAMKKTRDSHETYKRASEATGPSMYA
ncbi:MAG: proteasome assembly chaperone family protein [Candidatus Micrarchaeia archaeon]